MIGLFVTLRGIDVTAKWTFRPVSVFDDGFVKRLFGNGCRQTAGSRLSHCAYGLCGSPTVLSFGAAVAVDASVSEARVASQSERFIPRQTEGAHSDLRLI